MNPLLIPLYRFWVQVFIALSVLIFCGFGTVAGNRRDSALYSNLVFLVLGWFAPSPGSQPKKEGDQVAIDSQETNVVINDKNDS